jgi:predicted Fe-Mo cluster-binding NifX family protein
VIKLRIAIATRGNRKLSNKIADTFSRAPNFTIVTIQDNHIKSVEVIQNPGEIPDRGAGPLAARTLKDNEIDILLTGDMGPGARNILETLGIEIKLVEKGKKVKEVLPPYLKS